MTRLHPVLHVDFLQGIHGPVLLDYSRCRLCRVLPCYNVATRALLYRFVSAKEALSKEQNARQSLDLLSICRARI